jgi:hypothetical protein
MSVVHLHIGSYKTGTTSIQNTLHVNRAGLYKQGYHYPGSQSNHHLSFLATGAEKEDWPRQFTSIERNNLQQNVQAYFQELTRDFKNEDKQQIVSTEYLYIENEAYIESYMAFLKEFFDEIKVYVFLRDPVYFFRSAQQQMIKARSFVANPADWELTFREVIEAWSSYVEVEVIEYRKGIDSCEVFCEAVGLDYSKLDKPDKQSNTSLSLEQMLLLEKIQHQLYWQHEDQFKNHLAVIHNINPPFTTKPELKEEIRKVIYQNHREDLHWLKEEYDIDFLNEELEGQEVASTPIFENGKATVRDVYKVPSEEIVEKYEALVIDALLKKLVQGN